MKREFSIVDVFTARRFGGNQLAVVHDAEGMSAADMQAVAREFNYAETTFVLPPSDPARTAAVRIFSPGMEMPFAGHPTVGTGAVLVALDREPMASAGTALVKLEEKIGPVDVEVTRDGDQFVSTLVLSGDIEVGAGGQRLRHSLAGALNIHPAGIQDSWEASMGVPFAFCRLADASAVDEATLNIEQWRRHFMDTWAEAIFFFSGDISNGGQVYGRMFHPAAGISEDPATGSAAAALVASAHLQRGDGSTHRLSIEQGYQMGRPSRIEASVSRTDLGQRVVVRVGGSVVGFARGVIDA